MSNPLLDAAGVAKLKVAEYLSRYLTEIGARTILVEHEYTDGDYLDDYAAYYSKCFNQYSRKCRRLHFFTNEFDKDEFEEIVCHPNDDPSIVELQGSYLGFVVVRPLPEAIIGRTAIATYGDDNGRRHYPSTKLYSVNLFGIELTIRSLAFQEQDSVLAACATVALWCAFHKTADLFGSPVPTPAMITQVANRVVRPSRPIPSHGLDIYQICNSIRHMGLEPEVVQVGAQTPIVSLMCSHLNMGVPILLIARVEGVGLHAITINGYSLKPAKVRTSEVAPGNVCLGMTGLRVDEFYGHDDQIGPFARLQIQPSETVGEDTFPVVFDGSWIDEQTRTYKKIYPIVLIAPVYHKIRVTFIDVQKILVSLNPLFTLDPIPAIFPELEWDISLSTSNAYKVALKGSGVPVDLKGQLLVQQHPRFIWHVSLRTSAETLLELLIDATDMARSSPVYHCIWKNKQLFDELQKTLNDPTLRTTLVSFFTQRFFDLLVSSSPP